jgi:hypothetical protein
MIFSHNKFHLNLLAFIIAITIDVTAAGSSFKLTKIENCTSITERVIVERCEVENDEFNFAFAVNDPVKSMSVS